MQFALTVVAGDPGLVMPNGPFPIRNSRAHYVLKELGGYNCSLTSSDAVDKNDVAKGGVADPDPYQVDCRTEREGLAFDLYSTGMSPEQAVECLRLAIELLS